MNVTLGKQNTTIGQFQEFAIQLDQSLIFRFLDNSIVIQDENNNPQMKFFVDGGYLKYQLWDGSQYLPPQTITTPSISPEDSTILPHTPANTYLSIDNTGFKVFINLIESIFYFNQSLSVNMQQFLMNNELGDLEFKFKQQFGQNFYIRDYDTNANVLNINSNIVNIYNKQLKGLQSGTDLTDAVTLQQLLNITPNVLQVRLPDTQMHLRNSVGTDIVNIDNSRLRSSVVVQYTSHPTMSNNFYVPDWQNILDQLIQYQQTSLKNQPNGYAGIDSSGYLQASIQRNETLRLDSNTIKTYGTTPINTDNLTEGSTNLYFTDVRVLSVLTNEKGQPNGIPSLDLNGLIPSSQLPPLQVGVTYTGLNADKTNPAQYPTTTPIVGDRYIATDLSVQFVLTTIPYTNNANWIQLSNGGVDSVNTKTGTVSLITDDIPEGVDRYFNSGIVDYKLNDANAPNELLKLDSNGLLNTNQIPATLKLNNGSIQLVDNQINQMDIQNSLNSDSILKIQRTQVIASTPVINNGIPITNPSQFTDKAYVDTQLTNFEPTTIKTSSTQIQTNNTNILTTVNNFDVRIDQEGQTTQNTPIFYDSLVTVTGDQQLATKKYVDDILSAFIQNSGVSKEFLQALSQTSINTNGRITGWSIDVQSQTSSRINAGPSDTFNVIAGVYRFYIGMKIKEFLGSGLMNIAIVVRDTNTLQEYMVFDFRTIIDTSGGDQEFTMSQPYLWKLDNNANIEVYAQIGNTSYNIYESYLTIEEVEKYGVELGRDRITDPTLATTLLATNQYINFNVNNVDYAKIQNNTLTFEPGIKAKYDVSTNITNDQDLTTKLYVDSAVNNSFKSISDLGQMFEGVLSADQITLLTSGNQVRFNNTSLNTSSTMSMDTIGNITFTNGFIYQISVSLAVQFSSTTGFSIFSFKNFNTGISIPSSKLYIVTQPSSNSTQSSISFFLDLRTEVTPQVYILNIDSSLRLATIYSQYSRITCEQKQIISSQLYDRIQSQSGQTKIRLFNEGIEQEINGTVLQTITNDSNNVNQQLNQTNSAIQIKSTTDSDVIGFLQSNTNSNNTDERINLIITDINQEVGTINGCNISDNLSGNIKSAIIGGINADKLEICSNDPNAPEITIYQLGQNIPIQMAVKTGYNSNITIDEDYQFPTKKYVDDEISASNLPINQLPAPNGDVDFVGFKLTSLGNATTATDALNRQTADGRYYANTVTLNNITTPTGNVSLNNNKITNLATPTSNTDAVTKQYVDSNSGILPTGSLLMWPTSSPPSGYLLCDGSVYNTTTYSALFAVLGTGTLPDFRGKFPRGHDPTNIYDPDTRSLLSTQTDSYKNHDHIVPAQSFSTTTNGSHSHDIRYGTSFSNGSYAQDTSASLDGTYSSQNAGSHSHTVNQPQQNTNNSTSGSVETRPVNIAINYIIKY